MSISTDILSDVNGSDYDDLPSDVRQMVDKAETDLTAVGVNVSDDLKATEEADILVAPASSATAPAPAPSSFSSRGTARSYASAHGLKVVDNGAGSDNRWTVAPTSGAAKLKAGPAIAAKAASAKRSKSSATSTSKPDKPVAKKDIAIAVYAELAASGTLKRSNFILEMAERTGLEEKGASSYFYRIKGGKW